MSSCLTALNHDRFLLADQAESLMTFSFSVYCNFRTDMIQKMKKNSICSKDMPLLISLTTFACIQQLLHQSVLSLTNPFCKKMLLLDSYGPPSSQL